MIEPGHPGRIASLRNARPRPAEERHPCFMTLYANGDSDVSLEAFQGVCGKDSTERFKAMDTDANDTVSHQKREAGGG